MCVEGGCTCQRNVCQSSCAAGQGDRQGWLLHRDNASRYLQARDATGGVVARLLDAASVDDGGHIVDGDRRLRHVGGHHNLRLGLTTCDAPPFMPRLQAELPLSAQTQPHATVWGWQALETARLPLAAAASTFAHLVDPRRRAVEDALLLLRRQAAVQRQQPQRTAAVAQLRQRP